jgi:carbonic anhydrase
VPLLYDLLAANERYAKEFTLGDLPAAPRLRVAILTCMDARLDPAKFLGLREGDAHVIRNAGGRATDDAIRSLVVSYQLLGTQAVVVIHHTSCGMQRLTNERLRAELRHDHGIDASGIDFLPFDDVDASVREDVERLRTSPLIPRRIPVFGFVYVVASGQLRRVQ